MSSCEEIGEEGAAFGERAGEEEDAVAIKEVEGDEDGGNVAQQRVGDALRPRRCWNWVNGSTPSLPLADDLAIEHEGAGQCEERRVQFREAMRDLIERAGVDGEAVSSRCTCARMPSNLSSTSAHPSGRFASASSGEAAGVASIAPRGWKRRSSARSSAPGTGEDGDFAEIAEQHRGMADRRQWPPEAARQSVLDQPLLQADAEIAGDEFDEIGRLQRRRAAHEIGEQGRFRLRPGGNGQFLHRRLDRREREGRFLGR